MQEAFLRALNAIGSYAGGNARAWTLTIVRNTAYSWLGKNCSSSVVAIEDIGKLGDAVSGADTLDRCRNNPEAELIAKADAKLLQDAIAALLAAFRETLVLRDLQGLDYARSP